MTDSKKYSNVVPEATIRENEATFSHPWNPESLVTGTRLSELGGLTRSGVSLVRIVPGKESFAYHLHHREEEWIYILSGKGIAEVDEAEHEVNAGDFLAFPTPSVAHHLRNPFDMDLVYLMGGESLEHEVADFPRLGKRMIRMGKEVQIYDLADGKSLGPLET